MAAAARKGTTTASPRTGSPVAIATTAQPGFLGGWLSRIPCEYSDTCPALSHRVMQGGLLVSEALYPFLPPSKSIFLARSIGVGMQQRGTTLVREWRASLLPIWGMVSSCSLHAQALSRIIGAILKVQILNAEVKGMALNPLRFCLGLTLLFTSAPSTLYQYPDGHSLLWLWQWPFSSSSSSSASSGAAVARRSPRRRRESACVPSVASAWRASCVLFPLSPTSLSHCPVQWVVGAQNGQGHI